MKALVRFRTGTGEYAVPVEAAVEVRTAEELRPLPGADVDIVGLLDREGEALTVLSTLGSGRHHVLVVEAGGRLFGLYVERVTGVVRADPAALGPPPPGQSHEVVSGVLHSDAGMVLLIDVAALARRLQL